MAPPDFLRHVGRVDSTGSRIVVVFRQLPDEPENALIVYSDALSDRYHDDLYPPLKPNHQHLMFVLFLGFVFFFS